MKKRRRAKTSRRARTSPARASTIGPALELIVSRIDGSAAHLRLKGADLRYVPGRAGFTVAGRGLSELARFGPQRLDAIAYRHAGAGKVARVHRFTRKAPARLVGGELRVSGAQVRPFIED